MSTKFLATLSNYLNVCFTFIFGHISWNSPPWIKYLTRTATYRPKAFWGMLAILLLGTVAIYGGYRWYLTLPQPDYVIARVTIPKATPNEKVVVPDLLAIQFGVEKDSEFKSRAVAPLKAVGKVVSDGIMLSPTLPGKWSWESDNRLIFTPESDWPAGQTFTVYFNQHFFARNAKMASLKTSFTTLAFAPAVSEFKFYQDPIHPQIRQAIATITFNFPVDTVSLESHLALVWQASKNNQQQPIKYTLTYDDNKRTAYLKSDVLPLPETERYLELTLEKGIKPAAGPSVSEKEVKDSVLIPDASSYFKISKSVTQIIRNEQDRPEQVLSLETTLGITEADLRKSLHVFVLPQNYPATALEAAKPNYEWQDTGEVSPAILELAKPLTLKSIPADRDYATLHSFIYQAEAPGYLYVKIDKGTHAFGDFVLAKDYTAILKVPSYPREIAFLHKGSLLALGTEEKLSVLVRGLPAVRFDVARVLPEDIIHLITQTGGDFSNPYFLNYQFNKSNISEIFEEILPFDASDPTKPQYTALDLRKYLNEKSESGHHLGLFLLQARGWDTLHQVALGGETNRLILLTDLGLIVKNNNDGSHDVFVQSIVQGTPVVNASVDLLGKNGVAILNRLTDAQGRANFPNMDDFSNDREPSVYIVHNGNDLSFIPYNRSDRFLNYSRFDIGGVASNKENPSALTAYIFSDRGIYRPGESMHIGMIVKKPYVMPQSAGIPLEVTVTDPRGTTVKDEKISLNESGFLSLDFTTNATSPTGQYVVNLYIVKDNQASSLIGTANLNVAEFLPDRMRITAHLSQEQVHGWVSPNELVAKLGLWNLYGAPAAHHKTSGKILLTPQAVTFKEYQDYTFVDPLLDPKKAPKVFTDTLTESTTDAQGQSVFDLKLDRFEKATYKLTFFAEGFEAEGGRSVTTQISTLVSPLEQLVGYKPDGDLSFIKQQASRTAHFIAINPKLQQIAQDRLTLKIYALRPVTTLVKKDDGTYQYQSIVQSTQVLSNPFTISEHGTDYTLPTEKIGDFQVAIVDQNGIELTRFNYSVVGASALPLPKNAELHVKLNKTEFAPGEDIELQITSPYTGAGFITLERDKVYASQWFKTDTTSSLQKIQLPKDFQGDGYVNIAFVRDINSPEIFVSPLSYSVLPFAVTHQDHEIKVDLTVPAVAKPGEPYTITYQTDKPGKIIVFAVDEGILQVTKYATPNPVAFFFQKHALEVNTMQIVDQILPKFMADRELSAVGGDEGDAALLKNLNPFKRKTDAPVVYWSGIVDTDQTPRQLVYQVPDYFNGSLRVMAVAVASEAVGAGSTSSEIRGNFVINPNVPTFVAPKDEFEMTASIANNVEGSGKDAHVSVKLETTGELDIVGPSTQELVIPEGDERSVRYQIRAKENLGSASLKLTANRESKTSALSSSLSVRPASAFATVVTSGYAKNSKKSLPLDRVLYPEYRKVDAAVSRSPLILVTGLQRYLDGYPYGCTEQLTSKGFPLLAMANQPWFASDKNAMNEKIEQVITLLSQRQMSSGEFNYWPGVSSLPQNTPASLLAMHFLTEARAEGYTVPKDTLSNGIGYLRDLTTQEVTTLEQARQHAYAIYLLTRNEIVTTNYLTHLQLSLDQQKDIDWKNDITSAYLAATYQLLKSAQDADKLIQLYKPQSAQHALNDFYDAYIGDAQYLYLIAKHFPERLRDINIGLITTLADALSENHLSTVLSSYTAIAFAAYGQSLALPTAGTLTISEARDHKEQLISPANSLYQSVSLKEGTASVTFNNPDKWGYFYQLVQAGFDKNPPQASVQNGIEVYREYHNADDKLIDSIGLGGEIFVHLRARASDNQYHDNIALVDLLPGGFEPVRDSIDLKNVDYADIREDRVILFTSLGPDSKEIVYRIKATNKGTYQVPAMLGTSMYNPAIRSIGLMGRMKVVE